MREDLNARRAKNRTRQRVSRKQLTQEKASTRMGSIRQPWSHGSVVAGLTPDKLARTLRAAEHGDVYAYLTLAEEMEERDPHYGSVLATRKRAVCGLEPSIIPGGDTDKDKMIAEAVRRDIIDQPIFDDLMDGLADAFGKGYALVEHIWKMAGNMAVPSALKWRDPRHFELDRDDGQTPLLKTDENPMGEPLEPYKWSVHFHRQKQGLPIRGGLARLAAWSFLFKNYSVKDWVAFAETYGMPLRIGKYGPKATEEDRNTLLRAVLGIGTDAAAVIPDTMRIEFEQAMSGSSSESIFMNLADWCDRQMSKAVLGQTMSTDEGGRGGRAQAEVHDGLRDEIRIADAKAFARTISGGLIEDYVNLNFGNQGSNPRLSFPAEDEQDLKDWTENVTAFIDRGLRVDPNEIYPRLGLTAPKEDGAVLHPETDQTVTTEGLPLSTNRALNRTDTNPRPSEEAILDLQSELENDWQDIIQPITNPVEELARTANSAEDFLAQLDSLTGDMDGATFARALASAMTKARTEGDGAD